MAIHPSSNSLTIEVVEEYLHIAKLSLTSKKSNGGAYGYPAALMLFCVIEALGNSLLSGNEPFRILKKPPFSCLLTTSQVKQLEKWFRNLLVHNGMIAPGVCLSAKDSDTPFNFTGGEPTLIHVHVLYELVSKAWTQVDKAELNMTGRWQLGPQIDNAVDFSNGSFVAPAAASGSLSLYPMKPKRD